LPSNNSKLIYTPKILGSDYLKSIGINPTSGLGIFGGNIYKKPGIYIKLKSQIYSILDRT
jgi:hypothetical protein